MIFVFFIFFVKFYKVKYKDKYFYENQATFADGSATPANLPSKYLKYAAIGRATH